MSIQKSIDLEIVTPEKPIVHDTVDEVQLPGWDGAIGVLPGHAPLLALLRAGELWYRKGQDRTYFVLDFGLAEVLPDRVSILVRLADKPEDIDVAREQAAKDAAESELRHAVSLEDAERARAAMLTAMMKMRAAERARIKRGI